jgi:hypothetical protein
MKNTYCFFLIIFIISCGEKNVEIENTVTENLTQKQIDSVLVSFKFEYNNPIFIDSTSQVLLPITTEKQQSRKKISKSSYYQSEEAKYWNILFYNSKTEKTNLLTETKMRISDFDFNLINTGRILSNSILYKISSIDYNKDGKLNHEDPEFLYISKNDGTDLKRISPQNENLESYSIIPNSDQIIIRTKRDINDNQKFDNGDEIVWYKIDLKLSLKPIEIVNSKERKKIENLFFKQWLEKK